MNRFLGGVILCVWIGNVAAATEQVPLWEVGAGVAFLAVPAYRGSDKTHNFVLPTPFVTYHGDFLKADRHGVRGLLFETDRIDLTISTSASPPTQSDDIPARAGMPNLRPTVEIGPEIDLTLWRGEGQISFLKLRLPVRQAFTVGGQPRDIGVIFSPNLNADISAPFGQSGWTLGFLTGPVFATARQNAYFYGVDADYATAARPAYEARGGYGGWQFLASVSKRYTHTWVGAYIRQDTLAGAVFNDSPLVAQRNYASAGVAISWIFDRSTAMVDAEPD